jgi:hypothetical protein
MQYQLNQSFLNSLYHSSFTLRRLARSNCENLQVPRFPHIKTFKARECLPWILLPRIAPSDHNGDGSFPLADLMVEKGNSMVTGIWNHNRGYCQLPSRGLHTKVLKQYYPALRKPGRPIKCSSDRTKSRTKTRQCKAESWTTGYSEEATSVCGIMEATRCGTSDLMDVCMA